MIKDFSVIVDSVRSLENIGSIFRTADALGVKKIYLCGISGTPDSLHGNKIAKTALGAEKTIPWEHHKQIGRLIDRLKKENVQIISLEQAKGSVDYRKFKPKFPLALVIGNEVNGVSKSALQKSDYIIELPMAGKKESLNVAVSFGIAGYKLIFN
jgi:tRNA G18 (ribose-2'-O)-methylase SpoU